MFSITGVVLLLAISQLGVGSPIMVDRVQAVKTGHYAKRLAFTLKNLQDFEVNMLASVPVSHHLNEIFDAMKNIKNIDIAIVSKLREEAFVHLIEIQDKSTKHAERLGLLINLLNESADQFEELELFDVATYLQQFQQFFDDLSGELFDIIMAVETQISETEIKINNIINEIIDQTDPEVPKIRDRMALLDEMYDRGNSDLVNILSNLQADSDKLMDQLMFLMGKEIPDTASLSLWQRKKNQKKP